MQDHVVPKKDEEDFIRSMLVKGVKVSIFKFEEYSAIDFEPPATFFTRSALGHYHFYHTRDRAKAQEACNEIFGAGRYSVNTSKMQKGKGALTCTGTQTRRGQRR